MRLRPLGALLRVGWPLCAQVYASSATAQDATWSDHNWTRVEVAAGAHSAEGFAHITPATKFSWLVALKFPGGLSTWSGWYGYEEPYLRSARG
jgi:hypothetical protein